MTSAIKQVIGPTPAVDPGELLKGAPLSHAGGWQEIVTKVSAYMNEPQLASAKNPKQTLDQLTGLLRLQMDVSQYQMRVEVVSKVAESAVASLRKLQQSQ